MRVTLVHPQQFVAYGNHVSTIVMPPLGLAYLAASLREAGHAVTIVDGIGEDPDRLTLVRGSVFLRGLPNEEIVAKIPKDTELIGVGNMFSSAWLSVRDLVRGIRTDFPDVPIVLGGEHPTGLPEMCFAQSPVDVLVQGEGEETLVELADRLQRAASIADLHGIAYRTGSPRLNTFGEVPLTRRAIFDGQAIVNPRRNRLRGVDDIPLPAWDLVKVDRYQAINQPHGVSRGRFMPILGTRGCPFQCTFCTNPQMWTQLWIPRDYRKVVDEMELYIRQYQATDFQFEDLTAIVRKDWILNFCHEVLRRDLRITFQLPSGTRSESVDHEVATLMKQAGCHEFAFAPESGDPETLKIIKKQVNLKKLFPSARGALKAGISVSCFFIVGFPHETWKHILNTYWALAKCAVIGIKTVSVNVFSPQPATALFEELNARGRITLDDAYLWSLFEFPAFGRKKRSFNPRFSDAGITAVSVGGMLIFYGLRFLLRPHLLVKTVWEVFGKTSDNRLGKYLRSIRVELVRSLKFKFKKVASQA